MPVCVSVSQRTAGFDLLDRPSAATQRLVAGGQNAVAGLASVPASGSQCRPDGATAAVTEVG